MVTGKDPFIDQEGVIQDRAKAIISRYSNLGSNNPIKGPTARSLFYEAAKRTPGKYGQYLFYSLGNSDNNFIDAYYKSENIQYSRRISSLKSKNPTASFLINQTASLETSLNSGMTSNFSNEILGGLSAPYYMKDFLYCKYYGAIPNNYMITLRRFPTPVLDNMSIPGYLRSTEKFKKEGAGRPVAQAVTWFGGNTSNTLSGLISFSTGIKWKEANQTEVKTQEAMSKGLFQDQPFKFLGGLLGDDAFQKIQSIVNNGVVALDKNETLTNSIIAKGLRDKAKNDGGLLGEYIWVSVDTVNKGYVRDYGLPFTWGTGTGISVVFEYELTSVGEVNSKAAMLDLMGNLLSIGTNYGNFLTPDMRYNSAFPAVEFPGGDEGLNLYYTNPIDWIEKFGAKISEIGGTKSSKDGKNEKTKEALGAIRSGSGNIQQAAKTLVGLYGKDIANRLIKYNLTTSFLEAYQAPLSFLTGAPIGEWHLTIGNPCNPIAMIGNLLCDGVKIEFGDILGPDDFPTTLKATFTLKHARDRERGEIESIFNRGDGRLYQSTIETPSDKQSFGAYGDSFGNVNTEDKMNGLTTKQTGNAYMNTPDIKSPGNK